GNNGRSHGRSRRNSRLSISFASRFLVGRSVKPPSTVGSVRPTINSPPFIRESPALIDPLAEIVLLLQPSALFSKAVIGGGSWRITPPDTREPFYGVILEGGCQLTVDGGKTIRAEAGDFLLLRLPAICGWPAANRPPEATSRPWSNSATASSG